MKINKILLLVNCKNPIPTKGRKNIGNNLGDPRFFKCSKLFLIKIMIISFKLIIKLENKSFAKNIVIDTSPTLPEAVEIKYKSFLYRKYCQGNNISIKVKTSINRSLNKNRYFLFL